MPVLPNPKHERFAQELAKGTTATVAYVLVGYKDNDGNASKLSAKVQARVQEITARAAERTEISIARVLEELGKIGFANIEDYLHITKDGDPAVALNKMDRNQAAAVSSVSVEDYKEGRGEDARDVRKVTFKLHDKRAALVDIGKHLGMFVERHEMTGKDGGPIVMTTDAERAKALAAFVAKTKKT